MPKAASSFPVHADSKVGREWLSSAMRVHNELVSNPKAVTDCQQSKFSRQYSKWLKAEERYKPTWEQKTHKKRADRILRDQLRKIKNSKGGAGTTDCYPSKKAAQFRKWRSKNPSYLPGWSEALWIKSQLEKHDDVVKKASCCVDTRLDISHDLFKEWRAKNPPLPPIDEPTPKQYRSTKLGTKRKGRDRSPDHASDAGSQQDGSVSRSVSPTKSPSKKSAWPEPAEDRVLGMAAAEKTQGVVDEKLVRYVFEMSLNSSSNDNVARLVKEHTAARYPDIYQSYEKPEFS